MQLDVLTIGSGLIDAFLTIHDANEHIHLDKAKNEFRLTAGEKIQLDTCIFEVGGNACNVSVGLSRLGLSVGLMAEIGEDEFADKIMTRLESEGVATDKVQRKGQSSFAMGLNYKGERTLFVEHVEREHHFSLHGIDATCLYLTSMGHSWHHVYQTVRDYARMHEVFLALNPGTKQLKDAPGFIRDMLSVTDVLFINKDEGFRLIGQESGRHDLSMLLQSLHMLGAKTVVVTDGGNGSYVLDTQNVMYHSPIRHVPIIERTGAGDAYSTGFLAALLLGKDVTEAMRWGSANATSVIGKIGAQPGLLTKKQMHDILEEHELQVKAFR